MNYILDRKENFQNIQLVFFDIVMFKKNCSDCENIKDQNEKQRIIKFIMEISIVF